MGNKHKHHHQQQHHHHHEVEERKEHCMDETNTVTPPAETEQEGTGSATTATVTTTTEPPAPETPAPTPTPASSPVAAVEADVKSDYDRIAELAQGARAEYLNLKPEMQGRIHQLLNDLEQAANVEMGNFHTLLGEWKK